MPEISPPYRRIYFDSNILLRLQWPRVSQTLLSTINILKDFRIPAILLEPVEKELRVHFLRELTATRTKMKNQAEALASTYKSIGVSVPPISLPPVSKIESGYSRTSAKVVRQLGLLKRAPALRNTGELFEMAIQRTKPFQDKGKNFQDAVICLATIDDLVSSSETTGAFVSSDGIFEQSILDQLCETHGVKLILFESLQDLTDDLRKHLDEQQEKEWSDDEKLAEEAVNRELSKIQEFLEASLEVPTRMGFYGSRHIQRINRIEIARITRVETSPPSHRTPGIPVTITAQLEINIYATVRLPRPSPYLTEKLKVGEVRQPTRLADQIRSLYVDKDDILPRAVTVEIEAFRQGDKYSDLTPRSVSFGTSESRRSVYKPFGGFRSILGSI